MTQKSEKTVQVNIVTSPVCDVLRLLAAMTDNDCGKDSPELGLLTKRLQKQLRSRLLANIERLFSQECYPGLGLLSLIEEDYAREVPSFLQVLAQMPLDVLAETLLGFGRIYRNNPPAHNIKELLADRAKLVEHIRGNMVVIEDKIETLADVIFNTAETRDDLSELIEHFWYVILQPEAEKRAQLQQEVAEQCRSRLKVIGPLRMVTGLTNLHLSEKGGLYEKYILAPTSFDGTSLTAVENREENGLILAFNRDRPNLQEKDVEQDKTPTLDTAGLANIFNTLGDKTRLEIVRALVARPHYGQELAKMLGISNATVFYHLSQLEKTRTVHLERIEHRVYYVLDAPRLRYLLNQASSFLLG